MNAWRLLLTRPAPESAALAATLAAQGVFSSSLPLLQVEALAETAEQRELREQFEATFIGEEGRKHSPKSATILDGVKSFWDRMIS